ncbi:conserved Plasmodium protein, unknown function [Plasmodium yoelii]|uniref:Uncharacterized protein n=1 Tax=Plasmodium yoelii TaxID=5861 RepID=A0A078K7Q6_PLAYE|nr:conserved Plasmodium protein, unknown function [Plasmodium yoelii]
MELVIKTPYIEIFEKILKLFASISENINFRLTINKLELSGTNNISNHLIITIDKQFFKLSNVNYDGQMVVTGTVNSKDFYNCIFSNQIVKGLKSQGNYAHNQNKSSNNNNEEISNNYKKIQKKNSSNNNEITTSLNVSKLILKFNKENTSLEIGIKFKRYNTYCSAVIKIRSYNSPLKSYMYKNESLIQIEPTLFLLNLKDLSNERNIFLKSTDNSFIISALETSDFSLNKEKVKKEQFFYNNKKISIPLNKTIYFFKNKKFEDHSMSLPLNELKNIIKFCSDLNLLCLFSTKNFKENVIIYFGDIITNILKRNKKKIYNIKKEMNQISLHENTYKKKDTLCDDQNCYETENFEEFSYEQLSEYSNNNEITSCIYYISDNSNSSDDYNSSFDEMEEDTTFSSEHEIKNSISRPNIKTTSTYNNYSNNYDTNYNDIITGYIHFSSFFNISCNFNENISYKNCFFQTNNVDVYPKEKLTAHIPNEEKQVINDDHIEKEKKTQKDKHIDNISNDFIHKKINTLNLKINKSNDNTTNQNEEENKINKQMESKNNNINELNIPFEDSKKKFKKNNFFYKDNFKTDEDDMEKHGKDIPLNVNKEENIFKEKYEKENDNIKQINESEYFNYDKFMSKDNISDVYINMDLQIKKLNKTLKNINKYKKKKPLISKKSNNGIFYSNDHNNFIKPLISKKSNNGIFYSNDHNNFIKPLINKKSNNDIFYSNDHNNFKMKRKRSNNFIPNLKNIQINNNSYASSICSSGTEKYVSNKNRAIQSDTYYSFSDDSLVEKPQNENNIGHINYIKYFDNVYSKYDLCNNFEKLKNNINNNSYKEYDPYIDNYHKCINISPLNYNKSSKYRRINTDINNEVIKGNIPNHINYKNNNKLFYNNNLIYKKTC